MYLVKRHYSLPSKETESLKNSVRGRSGKFVLRDAGGFHEAVIVFLLRSNAGTGNGLCRLSRLLRSQGRLRTGIPPGIGIDTHARVGPRRGIGHVLPRRRNIGLCQPHALGDVHPLRRGGQKVLRRLSLLREQFRLKAADTKALSAYQKELHKAYAAKKETRQAAEENGLPEWYEVTGRGGLRFLSGLLANHLAENMHAFYTASSFFFYQGGVYRESEDMVAAAKVRELMLPKSASMQAINDTVGQWKMLIMKPVQEINSNPFILNLQNGLYNTLDDSFKAHTPEYFSTVQLKAAYAPNAGCPLFLRYLESMLAEEEIHLIQEIMGYLLLPVNKAQKSFVFVGAPNAGKSTLLNVVQEILLGSENVSNIPWQNLGDRFNRAELFGKLANIFADLPSKSIDDNGMFKALTGEDFITAERKNKDPFSFRPYARFLFSCNEIPRNYGDRSEGFYRRLLIIRFEKSVPKAKRDPNLAEKLAAERDGILMWALTGLKRLIASGYVFSETERTRAELEKYRIESNSVLSFAKLYCVAEEEGVTVRDDLFLRYKEYCGNAGMKPVSQTNFNKELEAGFPEITRGRDKLSKRRIWRGITYCEGGVEAD